eukprot:752142-Hanusia_phi.AAC.1
MARVMAMILTMIEMMIVMVMVMIRRRKRDEDDADVDDDDLLALALIMTMNVIVLSARAPVDGRNAASKISQSGSASKRGNRRKVVATVSHLPSELLRPLRPS